MNEKEIRDAIAVLEKGIARGYTQYAHYSGNGCNYLANDSLKGVRNAEKELTRLRRRLAQITGAPDKLPVVDSSQSWWARLFNFG